MTQRTAEQKLARRLQKETGCSYSHALRHMTAFVSHQISEGKTRAEAVKLAQESIVLVDTPVKVGEEES